MFVGAKGGSSSFKQTPDNLRSNDTFEGVLGLGIGPFKGPTRGLKSIKLDGTAIENETGQQNFQDFIATIGDGDPLKFPQRIQLKLGAGAAPTQVGLSLSNSGGNNPVWVTKTLNNTNADFIDLRFVVQQLFRQDAKGIYTTDATLEIQMKPVGRTQWINPTIGNATGSYNQQGFDYDDGNGSTVRLYVPQSYYGSNGSYLPQSSNYKISGKTSSSPVVYELRIGVPNTGSYANTAWDVRVRLLERESYVGGKDNLDQEQRQISWESMAAVYSGVLGDHEDWRGVAWLQLYGKASDQLTGVPEITGEYDTKIVKVPATVFNPDTRQYTGGIWDGSWVKAWTNDPAWVINDAISDELAGLSLLAPGSYLNKWDALELSKYCSQLVPNGDGGTHPRYSLNLATSEPQKAEEFVRYLAGAVGALAWDQGDGEWRCKVDKADAPVDIFTLDNIEGEFIYSNTDVDTRFNDIIGQFKNAEMDYRADAVELFDNTSIALIGRKPTTIALVGCTNRQEAMRRVKLRLRSAVNENRIVTFTTNRRGRYIEPLSTILIADGDLGDQDARTTGRIVSIAPDRMGIALRDAVYLAPGIAYTLRFTIPNPEYSPDRLTQPTDPSWTKPTIVLTRTVTNASNQRGSVSTLYLNEALPSTIATNMSVALEADGLPTMPRLFRVTGVTLQDDGERVSIAGINIDTGKWDAADNVSKADTVFQDLRGAVPPPTLVNGAPLVSLVRIPVEQGSQVNLQASWLRPPGAYISGFRIQYSINGGALQTAVERQQLSSWELPNATPGTYRVEVCTIDRRGGYSLPLVGELEVTQGLIDATQIKYNGGQSLEDLKPRQPGADVTGENVAWDTSNLGGRPAGDILDQLDNISSGGGVDYGAIYDAIDAAEAKAAQELADAQKVIDDANRLVDQKATAIQLSLTDANSEINLRITAAKAGADDANLKFNEFTQSLTQPGGLTTRINTLDAQINDGTTGIVTRTSTLETASTNVTNRITNAETILTAPGTGLVGRTTTLETKLDGNGGVLARITSLESAVGNPDSSLAQKISTLETNYGNIDGRVQTVESAYSDPNTGVARRLTDLTSTISGSGGILARLSTAETAITTNNNSIVGRTNTLEAQFRGETSSPILSRITTAEKAISDNNTAIASRASTLEAQLRGESGSNLLTRIVNSETAYTDGRFATAARASTLEAQLRGESGSNLLSRIQSSETAYTDGRFATASSLNTLSAQINGSGGLAAQVTQTASAVATANGKLAANWVIQADAGNGRAQLAVRADNYGGGVDIISDLTIRGATPGGGYTVVGGFGVRNYFPNGAPHVLIGSW